MACSVGIFQRKFWMKWLFTKMWAELGSSQGTGRHLGISNGGKPFPLLDLMEQREERCSWSCGKSWAWNRGCLHCYIPRVADIARPELKQGGSARNERSDLCISYPLVSSCMLSISLAELKPKNKESQWMPSWWSTYRRHTTGESKLENGNAE